MEVCLIQVYMDPLLRAAVYLINYIRYTVTPFKFAAIKVRAFDIVIYSRPFNFAVSYQNYFMVSYTNVVFSYTN